MTGRFFGSEKAILVLGSGPEILSISIPQPDNQLDWRADTIHSQGR